MIFSEKFFTSNYTEISEMQEENIEEDNKKIFSPFKYIYDDNEFSRHRKTRWSRNFERNENRCKSLEHIKDVPFNLELLSALRTLKSRRNDE